MSRMRAAPWALSVRIGICQPCQERALMPIDCSAIAKQARGHLLARRDDGVVFARIVERRIAAGDLGHVLYPADQFVGLAGHGGNDDRNLVAGIDLTFHMAGNIRECGPNQRRKFRRISSRCVPFRLYRYRCLRASARDRKALPSAPDDQKAWETSRTSANHRFGERKVAASLSGSGGEAQWQEGRNKASVPAS